MTKSLIDRQTDGTIKLTVTIAEADIRKTQEEVLAEMVKSADLAGFRKGMAPKNLVEEKLNQDHVRENILKKLLPQAYSQAVSEQALKPIMNPKLHIEKIEEGKDWVFLAQTCEMPSVDVGQYKESIKKISTKTEIFVPGKEVEPKKLTTEDIIKAVLENAKVQIPQILVEQETDRLLAQLLDDIKKLGLNLEQYLASTKRTPEDLRGEYAYRAQEDIKLEFVLQKIAELEQITVAEQEVGEAIQKANNPTEKQNLEANKYLLASILRQQKTLDFLTNL